MDAEQLKAAIEYAQQFEPVGGMDDLGRTIAKCGDQLIAALSEYEGADREARIEALGETQDLRDQLRWTKARIAELEETLDSKQGIPVTDVLRNANENAHKLPNMRTLMEEVAEAILADRGKHDDPLRLELTQIAGICINMIRRIDDGDDVGLKS